MKKVIMYFLVFAMVLSITGCESQKVKTAKGYIDDIYESTKELAELELQLELAEGRTDRAILRGKMTVPQAEIDMMTKSLEDIYEYMSEKEKNEIKQYAEDALHYYVEGIWEDN